MTIPKGYKLVPVEPTEHQMKIARSMTMQQEQTVGAEYRAMVKAAPTPPQPIFDETKERQLFEDSMIEASEEAGFGEPDLYRDSGGCYRQTYHQAAWGGWLACAQSRAKAGEETP